MTTNQKTEEAAPGARPQPAKPGVIASTEIGAGKPAQAGQPGEIRPIESSLVGDGSTGLPAASPRSDAPSRSARTEAAASTPPATGAAPRPVTDSAPRRGGFLPLALGGAVAAGLGAAAAIWALPHLPPEWRPVTAAVPAASAPPAEAPPPIDEAALIAAAEAAAEAAAREAARQAALDALAEAPAPEAAPVDLPADLAARLDALEQAAGQPDLSARLDALEQALAQQPDAPEGANPQALAALEARLEEQQARLEEQQARLEELAARPAFDTEAATALQTRIEQAAAEAEQRLAAAQAEADALQQAAAESTRRAEAVAAIAALQAALDEGITPDQARDALTAAGLETPEALAAPIPSLAQLQAGFPEAARAALRASLAAASAEGQGNLVTNFLRAQTGARSVTPREGTDPDAILSRADAALQAGRVAEALAEIAALPQPALAAPAMAEWRAEAEAHANAQAALSDLSPDQN
ncbi:hypothetical protein KY389_10455 [Paracoccus bogoriensis]|uniref:ABC transporter C-terminal domain-containing protein n=1 Tax=Paracoccus bogoriensis TaxID=242065 RepID=UPI001CA4CDF6|nr:ABC transporter C-terminal domain-containing protein [Paracoccus bogoriensis]MBW7057109.1 hypothetical protein [Paracoccus bogoriensis]